MSVSLRLLLYFFRTQRVERIKRLLPYLATLRVAAILSCRARALAAFRAVVVRRVSSDPLWFVDVIIAFFLERSEIARYRTASSRSRSIRCMNDLCTNTVVGKYAYLDLYVAVVESAILMQHRVMRLIFITIEQCIIDDFIEIQSNSR
jgi:hypothetical protein